MARLRDASAYRRLKRAYTRKSRVRSKSFVKSIPQNKIVRYVLGNKTKKFPYQVKILLFLFDRTKKDIFLKTR